MIVFFEGVDKTGKTTLMKATLKKTNYRHIMYDRGPISQIVYDKAFKRKGDTYELHNFLKLLEKTKIDCLFVLCSASTETIEQRLKDANEELPKELANINKIKALFEDVAIDFELPLCYVNTDEKDIDQCVNDVVRFIESYEWN